MKTARVIAAGVLSAGIALTGVLTATPAFANSATCGPITRSSDGHSASVHCWTQFALRAQACNAGGCSTLTSSWTGFPGTASINAGSAYIDQTTLSIGFR